jgi:hypothetical protein
MNEGRLVAPASGNKGLNCGKFCELVDPTTTARPKVSTAIDTPLSELEPPRNVEYATLLRFAVSFVTKTLGMLPGLVG